MTRAEFFNIYSRLRVDITDYPPIKGEIEERWRTMEELQEGVGPIDVETYETRLRGMIDTEPLE